MVKPFEKFLKYFKMLKTCLGIFLCARSPELVVEAVYPSHIKNMIRCYTHSSPSFGTSENRRWKQSPGTPSVPLSHKIFGIGLGSTVIFKSHKAENLCLAKLSSVQVWFSSMDPGCQECWLWLALHQPSQEMVEAGPSQMT